MKPRNEFVGDVAGRQTVVGTALRESNDELSFTRRGLLGGLESWFWSTPCCTYSGGTIEEEAEVIGKGLRIPFSEGEEGYFFALGDPDEFLSVTSAKGRYRRGIGLSTRCRPVYIFSETCGFSQLFATAKIRTKPLPVVCVGYFPLFFLNMGDNGESHQDALDDDEMLILRDFLRAWHDCMGKMKKTRAEAELKMRAMRKRINANIQSQSRKLTIAVTFQKWQEYGGVR